jgi:hypothetical protein
MDIYVDVSGHQREGDYPIPILQYQPKGVGDLEP